MQNARIHKKSDQTSNNIFELKNETTMTDRKVAEEEEPASVGHTVQSDSMSFQVQGIT